MTIDADKFISHTDNTNLTIAQLNCFNGKVITLNLLANNDYNILILQEPWIDPSTLRLPAHSAWHDFTPYDYTAKTYADKPRAGIYVSRQIPSWLITMRPSKSPLLTAIEVQLPQNSLSKICVVSAYNPPTHNTGLPVLRDWLLQYNDRRVASIIGIDSNLHHSLWNPAGYRHTHTLAKDLIKMCGSAGFLLKSQKQIPMFYSRARNTSPTNIDLTWVNYALTRHPVTNSTSSNNCGSDHQLLLTTIGLDKQPDERTHNTARFDTMAKALFCDDLENQLSPLPRPLQSREDIDENVNCLTEAITTAFLRQGKTVKTTPHRHKLWWDEEILNPIIRERNRARRWVIISKTQSAKNCYK